MYEHSEKQNFRVLPEKANKKTLIYKLYEVRNFWAVSERNTAQTVPQQGDVLASNLGGKGEAPGTSGRNIHKGTVSRTVSHWLLLYGLCLPHLMPHRNSFSWKAAQLAAVQGHSTIALRPKLRQVSFPARDEKSQWRSPYWPKARSWVLPSMKQSVWPTAYGSMTGYPAQGATWPPCDQWKWICYRKAVEMATQIWTLEESLKPMVTLICASNFPLSQSTPTSKKSPSGLLVSYFHLLL